MRLSVPALKVSSSHHLIRHYTGYTEGTCI